MVTSCREDQMGLTAIQKLLRSRDIQSSTRGFCSRPGTLYPSSLDVNTTINLILAGSLSHQPRDALDVDMLLANDVLARDVLADLGKVSLENHPALQGFRDDIDKSCRAQSCLDAEGLHKKNHYGNCHRFRGFVRDLTPFVADILCIALLVPDHVDDVFVRCLRNLHFKESSQGLAHLEQGPGLVVSRESAHGSLGPFSDLCHAVYGSLTFTVPCSLALDPDPHTKKQPINVHDEVVSHLLELLGHQRPRRTPGSWLMSSGHGQCVFPPLLETFSTPSSGILGMRFMVGDLTWNGRLMGACNEYRSCC